MVSQVQAIYTLEISNVYIFIWKQFFQAVSEWEVGSYKMGNAFMNAYYHQKVRLGISAAIFGILSV